MSVSLPSPQSGDSASLIKTPALAEPRPSSHNPVKYTIIVQDDKTEIKLEPAKYVNKNPFFSAQTKKLCGFYMVR